jgi:hypothetical protein
MTPRRTVRILAASAALLGAYAAPAPAQVFVDPGSPSGKEYAIPLESARRNAAHEGDDKSTPVAQGERSAPLFGAGLGDEPPADRDGDRPSASGSEPQRQTRDGSGGRVERALQVTNPVGVGAAPPTGGLDASLTIGAVALSALLLGAVIGSIARRRPD